MIVRKMKTEILLNPNCSELTMRIRINNLTKQELEILENYIKDLEQGEDWGETSWNEGTIFGTKVITISGNAPYNHNDEIEEGINKLPFADKLEIEYEEL